MVAVKDSDTTILKQTVAELEQKLGSLSQSLSQAVLSYRTLVVKSNPAIPEELITGDTIEVIDRSVEKTKSLIDKGREHGDRLLINPG